METNNFFCTICSFQFDKDIVYDIHMSFVHKIDKKQSNDENLIDIKQEGVELTEKGYSSIISEHDLQVFPLPGSNSQTQPRHF